MGTDLGTHQMLSNNASAQCTLQQSWVSSVLKVLKGYGLGAEYRRLSHFPATRSWLFCPNISGSSSVEHKQWLVGFPLNDSSGWMVVAHEGNCQAVIGYEKIVQGK